MDTEELLIDNKDTDSEDACLKLTSDILSLFKLGEWKKALSLSQNLLKFHSANLESFIQIYKSGCELACKIISSQNVKLGIQLTKRLNRLVSHQAPDHFVPFQCEILNYIACAYKQVDKLYLAKKYIERAMLIVKDFKHVSWEKSATYLNLCAILSAMGKHTDALNYAKTAISIAKEEMVEVKLSSASEEIASKASVLAIAYHNYAVEEEFLGNLRVALENYEKAYKILQNNAPNNVEMIGKFKSSYMAVRNQFQRNSRPSSAKSNISMKSFKSGVMYKPTKDLGKLTLKTPKNKALSTNLPKSCNTKSDKEFITFKNQCKEFLSSSKEWFRKEIDASEKNNPGTVKSRKIVEKDESNLKSTEKKESLKIEHVPVITAPIKGVENVRKPIIHEVILKRNPSKSLESSENDDESRSSSFRKEGSMKRANHASKKSTGVVFRDLAKDGPTIIEEFDEVTERQIEDTVKILERKPTFIKKPSVQHVTSDETKFDNFQLAIKLIVKVQARIRGYLARERFKLLKKRPNILYRGAKKIQNQLCYIIITSNGQQKVAMITDGTDEVKIVFNESISPADLFKRIDKNEKGIYLKRVDHKEKSELIRTIKSKISNEDCDVKFFYDNSEKVLSVKATKYSNSRVYAMEKKNVNFNSKPLLLRYINDEVLPYLQIVDQKLCIGKELIVIEREFLAKGSRILQKKEFVITANKIVSEEGFSVEMIAECAGLPSSLKEVFPVQEVVDCLSMLSVCDVESEPHLVFLPVQYQDSRLVLRKPDKKYIECIYEGMRLLNNSEYQIKTFKIQDDVLTYFFIAYSPSAPAVASYSITDKDLSSIYKLPSKKIRNNISQIVESMVIKSGKLLFKSVALRKDTHKEVKIPAAIRIQACLRGYLVRDANRYQNSKSSLIFNSRLVFNESNTSINIFKVQGCLLIELFSSNMSKTFYVLFSNPSKYFLRISRYFDIKCIAKAIFYDSKFQIRTTKGNLNLLPCSYYSIEEESDKAEPTLIPKIHTGADYIILSRELPNKNLLVKAIPTAFPECAVRIFSPSEIFEITAGNRHSQLLSLLRFYNGNILISEVVDQTSQNLSPSGDKSIYRTCKQISNKMFQVTLNLIEQVEAEPRLVFTLRQGSLANLSRVFEIDLKTACEKTGFARKDIIPMADYMIRKMLIVVDDEIVLDSTKPPHDVKKTALKIQALMRGFMIRLLIKRKCKVSYIARTKGKIDGNAYTVLLYKINEDYKVALVSGTTVYSAFLDKKLIEDHLLKIDKFLANRILPRLKLKKKNNQIVLAGLKDLRKNIEEKNKMLESGRSNKLAYLSPRSLASIFQSKAPEPLFKVLKWRAPRIINSVKCLVSIYEMSEKGLVEVFIIDSDSTLTLEVKKELIENPDILASQIEIDQNTLTLKNESFNTVYRDKRYISDRLAEIVVFSTEKGFFATAYLPEENKSLNAYLGSQINPEEVARDLKIKEVMGQDVLLVSR